jgi:branched-subunit amino acid transport protein AzlD
VYCLKETGSDFSHTGIANFLAVAVVAVSYKWKHNTFLSILFGTAVNMILIQVI